MGIVFALLAATSYGAGDFFGGLAARHAPVVRVTLLSQVVGALLLVVLVPLVGGDPSARALAVGAAAGLAGALALLVFYRAMGSGSMSVVAPVSALASAAIPVVVGLATGEDPAPVALVGVAVALAAIGLVSQHGPPAADDTELDRQEPGTSRRTTLLLGLLAGTLFATVFLLFDHVSDDAGLWPLVGARVASVPFLVLVALVTRTALRPGSGTTRIIVACGVFDMGANAFLVLAFGSGLLVLVAVISSLYPASTLVLARVVLNERVTRVQATGLAVAACAVVLIALA
ncbi:MAG: EamA family transporter [Acidimicrobiales bacterium]|nr:EamA family transporter [Acidimicrobiales bacterium]